MLRHLGTVGSLKTSHILSSPTSTVSVAHLGGVLVTITVVWLSLLLDSSSPRRRSPGRGATSGASVGFGSLLSLVCQGVVGVEVRVELSTSTGFVGEELNRVTHVSSNASFQSIAVVLGTGSFSNIEKVDDHTGSVRVVTIAADLADGMRAYVLHVWDVLWRKAAARGVRAGRTAATATAVAPLILGRGALRAAIRSAHGNLQSDLIAGLTDVREDYVGISHGGVAGSSTDVTGIVIALCRH